MEEKRCKKIPIFVVKEDGANLPFYATRGASGADLYAYIESPLEILPGQNALIPTGISVVIPSGYEMQIRPRSGLALKHQIGVLNSPGTIDSDYRGEVQVILMNLGKHPFTVIRGMRIAQAVFSPIVRAYFVEQGELFPTERGEGSFGHTGMQ